MRRERFLIVGQGFAGTALAWRLHLAGQRFLMIDAEPAASASRVAAGLVTPVTGRRLVKADTFDAMLAEATAFYRRVEAAIGAAVFHARPALRLFQSEDERRTFAAKQVSAFAGAVDANPAIPPALAAPLGGFAMSTAAQLDAPAYLAGSRAYFAALGMYEAASLDLPGDGEVSEEGVTIAKLGLKVDHVVFCQGYAANPWFARVPFQPAQGDVLTVRVPGYVETRVVHRGIWLAPVLLARRASEGSRPARPGVGSGCSRSATDGDGPREPSLARRANENLYLCGSTYSWEPFDGRPSTAGRAELERRLRDVLTLPFEVIDHRAAVRPIICESRPRLGTHPDHPRLAFFNGLGSKGALVAPHFAGHLARHLLHGDPLDPEFDVRGVL